MSMPIWTWMVVIAFAGVSAGAAADRSFTSGPSHVALLELYTSEGCSSCPSAEQWLGERRGDAGLWKKYVPLSFHVTYWDYLGWQDALAQPSFTARQQAHAAAWRSGSVYTPCFVRDGAEWHPGDSERVKPIAAGQLTVHELPSGEWEMSFVPPKEIGGDFDGYVALLGQGIVSKVRAGENKGRTLAHDFVAMDLAQAPLSTGSSEGTRSAVFRVKTTAVPMPSLAIAAWVTRRGKLDPLQATGGDLGK